MACLDTTILIDLLGKKSQLKERAIAKVESLIGNGQSLATTRFNVAELYVGVSRSRNPQREEKSIHSLLSNFEILEFTDTGARIFGFTTGFLQTIGKPSGDMDVLIAATAMVHGRVLVTRNPRRFQHIPDLRLEDY